MAGLRRVRALALILPLLAILGQITSLQAKLSFQPGYMSAQ